MTPRLPIPGADNGQWGGILNEYLMVSLASDGTLKDGSISELAINGTLSQTKITRLTTDLAAKANTTHTHTEADITNLTTNLAAKAPLTSPTFTGIVTVPTPINNTDAVTKGYVDTAAGTKLSNITGLVTQGTNVTITGSGTSGSPYNISASGGGGGLTDPTTTKGDILVRNSSTVTRQATGTDGQVLTADATQTTGIKWATPTVAPVTSVNTRTGVVTGLAEASDVATALAGKASTTHTHTASQISDSTTVGRSLLTATDAGAARSAIGAGTSSFDGTYTSLTSKPTFATVATSGSYTDLTNTPTIPAGQVNSDWNAVSGVAQILNKPSIPTVSDATTTTKGIVQLAGDLGGTAASPTVPGLASKENTVTAGATTQYYRGDKSWQTLDKTAVNLANVDNTSDANKPISSATTTALNLKANLANPTFTGTVTVPTPTNTTDAATKTYVDTGLGTKANTASLATVATSGSYTDLTGKPTLGGAAALSVGTTTGTVAAGDDSRMTNARTPTAHASTHASAGSDAVTLAQSQVTGLAAALTERPISSNSTITDIVVLTAAAYAALSPPNSTTLYVVVG
jgi:hypothetical protein